MRRRDVLGGVVCGGPAYLGLWAVDRGGAALRPTLASALRPVAWPAPRGEAAPWPAWQKFKARFMESSGRLISSDKELGRTFSEGQAYAMFFALVANDRAAFDRLLDWTVNNLCGGDLGARLPAWLWGRKDGDDWGVIDANASSDADLWLAYTLGEAGRLWSDARLRELSDALAARIVAEECAALPGLGWMLLPGPHGFVLGQNRWRLNPSYLPLQLLRWFAAQGGPQAGVWAAVAQNMPRVVAGAAPLGWVADWVLYDAAQGFVADRQAAAGGQGSYDAIRVYLWAGMLPADEPQRAPLLGQMHPVLDYLRRHDAPPETVDTVSGAVGGAGSAGFVQAVLPFLRAHGDAEALRRQRATLADVALERAGYYDQALALFSQGWMQGWYRFAGDGRLLARWSLT